jgi:hypothetical protein
MSEDLNERCAQTFLADWTEEIWWKVRLKKTMTFIWHWEEVIQQQSCVFSWPSHMDCKYLHIIRSTALRLFLKWKVTLEKWREKTTRHFPRRLFSFLKCKKTEKDDAKDDARRLANHFGRVTKGQCHFWKRRRQGSKLKIQMLPKFLSEEQLDNRNEHFIRESSSPAERFSNFDSNTLIF